MYTAWYSETEVKYSSDDGVRGEVSDVVSAQVGQVWRPLHLHEQFHGGNSSWCVPAVALDAAGAAFDLLLREHAERLRLACEGAVRGRRTACPRTGPAGL